MRRLIGFLILSSVKILSHLFYRGTFAWATPPPGDHWRKARLLVFLNHTSLYEPLSIQGLPFYYLWHLSGRMSVPGADITLNRPLVGLFWKLMVPHISSISRKKDATWDNYVASIRPTDTIVIAPEGRMRRPDGLDKFGRPMTVRGGVAEIIEDLEAGGMILCLSGGLHHVQRPGQFFPKIFKPISMNLVYLDVSEYKARFSGDSRHRKLDMVHNLQRRLENDCPKMTSNKS